MSIAGVIIYEIKGDGSLEGRWTHPAVNGLLGTERATGGMSGQIAGSYSVEIYSPNNDIIFRGSLVIAALGAAYSLTWVGSNLLIGGNQSKYTGIGLVENNNMLVAAFQEVA